MLSKTTFVRLSLSLYLDPQNRKGKSGNSPLKGSQGPRLHKVQPYGHQNEVHEVDSPLERS